MGRPLIDRIPFSRIFTILAVIFGVALGLCGLNTLITVPLSHVPQSASVVIVGLIFIEAGAMLLSGLGMALTALLWLVLAVARSLARGESSRVDGAAGGNEDSDD